MRPHLQSPRLRDHHARPPPTATPTRTPRPCGSCAAQLEDFVCSDITPSRNIGEPRDCALEDALWAATASPSGAPCCSNSTLVRMSMVQTASMIVAKAGKSNLLREAASAGSPGSAGNASGPMQWQYDTLLAKLKDNGFMIALARGLMNAQMNSGTTLLQARARLISA